jgi:hypothetical protein
MYDNPLRNNQLISVAVKYDPENKHREGHYVSASDMPKENGRRAGVFCNNRFRPAWKNGSSNSTFDYQL